MVPVYSNIFSNEPIPLEDMTVGRSSACSSGRTYLLKCYIKSVREGEAAYMKPLPLQHSIHLWQLAT